MPLSRKIIPYKSSVVLIGSAPLGGNYPIRIQSMTNTDTMDTKATVTQCIRIIEAGADYVRITAQGIKEAENLAVIKNELRKAGFLTPLIADIHFNPAAAETAARIVEKIRINPGNYADKRASFENRQLTEKQFNEELERIHKKLLPLITICHENKTVVRLGINHGSLSDRIMDRFGNTPEGMVHSAIEYIRIFRNENFNDLVLSMKSSDTGIMIEATRLLVSVMQREGLSYPLHLGVTEAGEGVDGRIRSAAGIGALLSEGIGDTIRISLTEDPEKEILAAKILAGYFPRGIFDSKTEKPKFISPAPKPDVLKRISGPLVIANMSLYNNLGPDGYRDAGFDIDLKTGEITGTDTSADLIIASGYPDLVPDNAVVVIPFKKWYQVRDDKRISPLFSPETFHESTLKSDILNVLLTGSHFDIEFLKRPATATTLIIFTFNPDKEKYAADHFLSMLDENKLRFNIVLNPVFNENIREDLIIKAGSLLGRYLIDKRISGISITNKGDIDFREITALAFSILQGTGTRITQNIYLSCPTCGRTKFNLIEALKKVRERTNHLKGLKIAVMGCIVNGPGEMAGADYGYVGGANGRVHIYKGMVPVLKNIAEKDAAEELLKLIESDQASL